MVRIRGVRIVVVLVAAIWPSGGAAIEQQSTSAAVPTGLFWSIFVDDLHIEYTNTGRLRNLLTSMSTELFRDGDTVAVRAANGPPATLEFIPDRRKFPKAITRISGASLKPAEILRIREGDGPDEVRYRASVALTAAYNMLDDVERTHAPRKALLYISGGYYLDTVRLLEQLRVLTGKATSSHITIFAIDPRALTAPAIVPAADRTAWESYLFAARISLRQIAYEAGGFAILEPEDLAGALDRINAVMR